ncbi:hypothetical protein [Aliiglaciecola sp. M165]|uniref:hypothetical protein n=1 Tax=Aliiglaciecola sp. M165 TaxID=2593649 RepID=UPI00117DAE34|nr:hypothetical protein [Aliiglaciecola sp. M165]TRY28675.1 hypothetical protein FM019_20660 [Aliiglaciecola sp. M165]
MKEHQSHIYKQYSLDGISLMIGPNSVDWDFQKYIHKQKYKDLNDPILDEMCSTTRKFGIYTYSSALGMLLTVITKAVLDA